MLTFIPLQCYKKIFTIPCTVRYYHFMVSLSNKIKTISHLCTSFIISTWTRNKHSNKMTLLLDFQFGNRVVSNLVAFFIRKHELFKNVRYHNLLFCLLNLGGWNMWGMMLSLKNLRIWRYCRQHFMPTKSPQVC